MRKFRTISCIKISLLSVHKIGNVPSSKSPTLLVHACITQMTEQKHCLSCLSQGLSYVHLIYTAVWMLWPTCHPTRQDCHQNICWPLSEAGESTISNSVFCARYQFPLVPTQGRGSICFWIFTESMSASLAIACNLL